MKRASTIAQNSKQQQPSSPPAQLHAAVKDGTFQFADKRASSAVQRQVQAMASNSAEVQKAVQMQAMAANFAERKLQPIQKKENATGLPDQLKSGVESLSGISMNDVKVHYNSSKPATLQAHAYAQGTQIHLGRGQEKHLPHEAWHVVQQKQGRVRPTTQLRGKVNVNDDRGLEREADVMGAKALGQGALQRHADGNSGVTLQRYSLVAAGRLGDPGYIALEAKQARAGAIQRSKDRVHDLRAKGWSSPVQMVSLSGIAKGIGNILKHPITNSILIITEGILSVTAGGLMIATVTPPGLLAGIPMVVTGGLKIVRGIIGLFKYGSNSEANKKRLEFAENVLRGLESISQGITALALIPGPLGIVLMVQAAIKALRSIAQFVESKMEGESLAKKVMSGIGATLHYLEVAAGFVAAGFGFSHSGLSAFGPFATAGISTSKTMRATGKAVKTAGMQVPAEGAPLLGGVNN